MLTVSLLCVSGIAVSAESTSNSETSSVVTEITSDETVKKNDSDMPVVPVVLTVAFFAAVIAGASVAIYKVNAKYRW